MIDLARDGDVQEHVDVSQAAPIKRHAISISDDESLLTRKGTIAESGHHHHHHHRHIRWRRSEPIDR